MVACRSRLLALTALCGLLISPALAAQGLSVPGSALTDSTTRPAANLRPSAVGCRDPTLDGDREAGATNTAIPG